MFSKWPYSSGERFLFVRPRPLGFRVVSRIPLGLRSGDRLVVDLLFAGGAVRCDLISRSLVFQRRIRLRKLNVQSFLLRDQLLQRNLAALELLFKLLHRNFVLPLRGHLRGSEARELDAFRGAVVHRLLALLVSPVKSVEMRRVASLRSGRVEEWAVRVVTLPATASLCEFQSLL